MVDNVHDLRMDLKCCSIRRDLEWGRRIHAKAVESRHESNLFVVTALINMYAKCGSMVEARGLFDNIQKPNVVPWTILILGYVENGEARAALDLFSRMKTARGCFPDSVMFVATLKACSFLAVNGDGSGKQECLQRGRQIHSEVGCHLSPKVQSTLIDMYSKCGSMVDAHRVFDSIQKPDVVSWSSLILGYTSNGEENSALDLFSKMKAAGCASNSVTYVAALKACGSLAVDGDGRRKGECLIRGRGIHSVIGSHLNLYVQSTLIDMYANCGSMVEARQVFDSMQKLDVVSWNAMILGYAKNGDGYTALELFSRMKAVGRCSPDSVTYVAALNGCTSVVNGNDSRKGECLERGKVIHSEIGSHLNIYVESALIEMYSECGSMVDARRVFDNMQNPDLVSWNAIIMGYAENGEGHTALDLLIRLKAVYSCPPDSVTYVAAFKACTSLALNGDLNDKEECLKRGQEIHSEIGSHLSLCVQNTLIDMYAKCGSMVRSRRVFDNMQNPDVVSWNILLLGYTENGEGHVAVALFFGMKTTCPPNSITYVAALKACGMIGALGLGRKLHSELVEFDARLVTCLVDFYAKCGSIEEARLVFDSHSRARVVPTWNALLAGYSSFGQIGLVFKLFEAMQEQGFRPDAVTFVCMLSCCSHAGLVNKAREYIDNMPVQYGVTPSVMHYTCMIDVLGRADQLKEAIALLQKMPCNANAVTWMALLGACHKWKNVEIGKWAFHSLGTDNKGVSDYA